MNGIIIGKAEDYMTAGPARVCLGLASIDLEASETAYLHYRGIHFGSIKVIGPRGSFVLKEGGAAWAKPGGRSDHFSDWRGRTVTRNLRGGRPRYLLYAPDEEGEEQPAVWLEGDAFDRSQDMGILERINTGPDEPTGCQRHYDYGWSYILGTKEE